MHKTDNGKEMKKVDVILGLQWGDEGKGKVVDVLTPQAELSSGRGAGNGVRPDVQS